MFILVCSSGIFSVFLVLYTVYSSGLAVLYLGHSKELYCNQLISSRSRSQEHKSVKSYLATLSCDRQCSLAGNAVMASPFQSLRDRVWCYLPAAAQGATGRLQMIRSQPAMCDDSVSVYYVRRWSASDWKSILFFKRNNRTNATIQVKR